MSTNYTNISNKTNLYPLIGINEDFPENFDDWEITPLGGGTDSVFLLSKQENPRKYVLKFGAHPDANKAELLCKLLYHEMKLNIPKTAIYQTLSENLLKKVKTINTYISTKLSTNFVISEYIEPALQQPEELIEQYAKNTFTAHVLLGNIDLNHDNFLASKSDNKVYLIDAGSNFLFRSLGANRNENPDKASELKSLLDPNKNTQSAHWFKSLSLDEIKKQLDALIDPKSLHKSVWKIIENVELPADLQNRFFKALYNRIDVLQAYVGEQARQHKSIHPWEEVAEITHNHIRVLGELKQNFESNASSIKQRKLSNKKVPLSQSELHIKTILKNKYIEGDLERNIENFVHSNYLELSYLDKAKLIETANNFIRQEKEDNDKYIYFYHSCSSDVAFVYEIYSSLSKWLEIRPNLFTFRIFNKTFQKFKSLEEFTDYFSQNGSQEINDNSDDYADCVISTNPFLFGNYQTSGESTIHYWINNYTDRELHLKSLLEDILNPTGVSKNVIKYLLSIYQKHYHNCGGSIYQAKVAREHAKNLAYPAEAWGVIKKHPDYKKNDLGEILPCLMNKGRNNKLAKKDKIYIKTLQARLFATSQIPLILTNQSQWKKSSNFNIDNKIISSIIKQAFANNTNTLGTKEVTPGFRLLSYRQAHHNLKDNNKFLIIQKLLTSITKENKQEVIDIIHNNPELKDQKMSLGNNYLNLIYKPFSGTPLEWILFHKKSMRTDKKFICQCFGDRWYNQLKINTDKKLIHTLKLMPEDRRYNFAIRHQSKIQCNKLLEHFFKLIPQNKHYDFILEYEDKIKDGWELAYFLKYTPRNKRYDFALRHIEKIKGKPQLESVLYTIPEKNIYSFALKYERKIKDGYQLAVILDFIPQNNKYTFVLKHINKIIGHYQLQSVLYAIPENKRYAFALKYERKIKDGYQLVVILKFIPQKKRYNFVLKHENKIITNRQFEEIYEILPQNKKYDFTLRNKDKISNGRQIKVLPKLINENSINLFNMRTLVYNTNQPKDNNYNESITHKNMCTIM